MVYLGDSQITSIKLGDADVLSVCLGDNLVWQGGVTPTGVFALKFTNPGSSSVELFFLKQGSPTANLTKDDFEVSTDGGDTWAAPSGDSTYPVRQEIQAGQEILFRRKGSGYLSDSSGYYQLASNGPLLVSGPIRAMLGDSDATAPHEVSSKCFSDFYAGSYLSAELDFGGITSAQSGAFYNFNSYNVSTLTVKNLENDLSAESTSFQQAFRQAQYGSDELRLSGLHLSGGGFQSMFDGNPNLRSVRLSVEDVYANGNGNPMESMFKNCSALEDVEISCNPQGMSFTNGYEMIGILQGCPNLRSVVVRGLSSVGNGYGTLQGAFQNCNIISSVSFPDLVKPYGTGYNGRYAFYQAFKNVSSMTELRFGAGSEDDVKRLMGWDSTFSMTNYGQEHCSVWCGSHMIKPYDSWERDALSDAAVRFIGTKSGAAAKISRQGSNWTIDDPSLETSEDGQSWNPYTIGNEIQLSAGQVVYMRASQRNDKFSQNMSRYFTVELSDADFGGSLKNLITPLSDDVIKLPDYSFCYLFKNLTGSVKPKCYLNLRGISSYGEYSMNNFAYDKFSDLALWLQDGISSGSQAFEYAFRYIPTRIYGTNDFQLMGLSAYGGRTMRNAFEGAQFENVSVGLDSIVQGMTTFQQTFKNCSNLKKVDISASPEVPTAAQIFQACFDGCGNLKDVAIHGVSCLGNKMFKEFCYGASNVSSMEFPDLLSCQEYSLSNTFTGMEHLSVIRFGHEEVSADVLSSFGWDNLWGIQNTGSLSVWAGEILLYSPPPPWSPDTYIYKTSDTAVNFPLFTFEGNSGYPEFRAELCGDANGNCFLGFQGDDNADYRLFNVGNSWSNWYMDCGSNRENANGPDIRNRFGLVSAWNCGWQISTETAGTGYQNGTPTTDTLSGVIQVGGPNTTSRFAIGRLSVLQNGTLTHLYVPINDTTNGAGLSDAVEHTTHFPETQGVWNYVET